MLIVKAKKTSLKTPLSSTASSFKLNELVDHKGNTVALANFGTWFVVVLKQGDSVEMIKCDGLTQNADGSASCTVASSGRHLNGTSPYAGSSTGLDFNTGAEAIITNDPLTIMEFGRLNNTNAWTGANDFSVVPTTTGGNPTTDNSLVRKAYVDLVVAGSYPATRIVVTGLAGETITTGQLLYLKTSDGRWWKCDADTASTVENVLLGIAQGAGTAGNAITNGVLIRGYDNNQTGLTANAIYYASNTAGGILNSVGTTEVTIGFSLSTTEIYFSPGFNQMITEDIQDALAGNGGTPSNANKFVTETGLATALPAGTVVMWATTSAPSGWLACDGSAVSRTTYATLYSAIGTQFGSGDGSTTFNLPDFGGRMPIGYKSADRVVIEDCEDAWNESVDADVTASLDAVDFKVGSGSAKFVVAGTASAGDILATEQIGSTNLYGYTSIALWIKSTVALSAGDLQLLLDNSANCASPLETIDIPAISANVWTRVSLTLANPASDTAIVSVGIKMVVDKGAFTLNIDDIAVGDNFDVGLTGGEKKHTLVDGEIPAHTHSVQTWSGGGGTSGASAGSGTGQTPGSTSDGGGGDLTHNNLPPYLSIAYIIKT